MNSNSQHMKPSHQIYLLILTAGLFSGNILFSQTDQTEAGSSPEPVMVRGLSFKEVKKGKMYPESQAYVVELAVKFDEKSPEASQELILFAETESGKSGDLVIEEPAEKRKMITNGEVIRVLIPYRWTFGSGAELEFDLTLQGKDGRVLDQITLELTVPPPPPPPGLP